MMNKQFWNQHGSTILTCVGAVGVVATAIFTAKATTKANDILEEAEKVKGEELTKWEKVKIATPTYIPTILTASTAIGCVIGANILNKKHQAAITSAYILLDQGYKEYKKKVTDIYGEEGHQEIQAEIAKDNYEAEENIEEDDGKNLFYDEYSQQYFRATNETVLRAEYELNRMLVEDYGACLNDYFKLVGLPSTDYGDYVGWSSAQMFEMYWSSWIHFNHHKTVMDDGLECYIISVTEPMPDFEEY